MMDTTEISSQIVVTSSSHSEALRYLAEVATAQGWPDAPAVCVLPRPHVEQSLASSPVAIISARSQARPVSIEIRGLMPEAPKATQKTFAEQASVQTKPATAKSPHPDTRAYKPSLRFTPWVYPPINEDLVTPPSPVDVPPIFRTPGPLVNEPAFSYDSDGDTEPETELETEEESDVAPGTYRPRIWVADAETDTPGVEAEAYDKWASEPIFDKSIDTPISGGLTRPEFTNVTAKPLINIRPHKQTEPRSPSVSPGKYTDFAFGANEDSDEWVSGLLSYYTNPSEIPPPADTTPICSTSTFNGDECDEPQPGTFNFYSDRATIPITSCNPPGEQEITCPSHGSGVNHLYQPRGRSSDDLTSRRGRRERFNRVPEFHLVSNAVWSKDFSSRGGQVIDHNPGLDQTSLVRPIDAVIMPPNGVPSIPDKSRGLNVRGRNVEQEDAGGQVSTKADISPTTMIFRPARMATREIFECLIQHGCCDLNSSVDPDGFSKGIVIGGSFGDIWKGRLRDGTIVAIKVWRFTSMTNDGEKDIKRATREIYNWSKMDHENVHKLLGVIEFQGRLGMVSKWMDNGNLYEYVRRGNLRPMDRYQLCIQVAKGVDYLHQRNIIHGDLKALNVLVSSDGLAKVTDFDYSIMSDCSLMFSVTTRMGGGTLRWMAPELILESTYQRSKQTDIYALGMTFLEIITSNIPYYPQCRTDGNIYNALSKRILPERSMGHFGQNKRDDEMWALLVRCWNREPSARPTVYKLLVWLQNLIKETPHILPVGEEA
ncbi:hypothetical protein CTheo_7621 [Ceratobasidium theobromae]|uniref:Protein kinase domain-containing protein n=1 Tax=Ceratobasidium theobromae TaxID=1582974 RepID=A0A5N5QBP8_9AGAM|nr:hypothetical protein CTheo_7621 [Ceratobasidium theobromae]